ncbi:SDR family oxidoreductase [Nonomuraea africana]|uniref:3-oxoacyl-[acyl-carrier protein] reductase n=1 Tax=Nonomuraea africana TaxID=46171 RepID=A0ABR9KCH0_9ACTN|nr:SDR family oxidoreductase [Nonomuraea africana]MBE1559714.1 3-oxoacyl-[acyl-carrier protein] reductase [Nonomuraea africana]
MGPLTGRTALVTGGSRGIGRAIVQRLAVDGASVVFTYATAEAAARRVAAEIDLEVGALRGSADGGAWPVRLDLTDLDDIRRLFATARDRFAEPGLDILVNNAAIAADRPIAKVTEADYDHAMAVNVKGVFFTIQHALPHLRDGARIINLSTASTAWPGPGEALYAAGKAAVEQFSRVAAKELAGRGITVNTISPGPTDTDLLRGATTEQERQAVASMTPLGRLGTPADVAGVVAFLAGPDSGWVTGQNILVDGGLI